MNCCSLSDSFAELSDSVVESPCQLDFRDLSRRKRRREHVFREDYHDCDGFELDNEEASDTCFVDDLCMDKAGRTKLDVDLDVKVATIQPPKRAMSAAKAPWVYNIDEYRRIIYELFNFELQGLPKQVAGVKISWLFKSYQKCVCRVTAPLGMRILNLALANQNTYAICVEPRIVINSSMSLDTCRRTLVLYRLALCDTKFKLREVESCPPEYRSFNPGHLMSFTPVRAQNKVTADNWEAIRILHIDSNGFVSFCISLQQIKQCM